MALITRGIDQENYRLSPVRNARAPCTAALGRTPPLPREHQSKSHACRLQKPAILRWSLTTYNELKGRERTRCVLYNNKRPPIVTPISSTTCHQLESELYRHNRRSKAYPVTISNPSAGKNGGCKHTLSQVRLALSVLEIFQALKTNTHIYVHTMYEYPSERS